MTKGVFVRSTEASVLLSHVFWTEPTAKSCSVLMMTNRTGPYANVYLHHVCVCGGGGVRCTGGDGILRGMRREKSHRESASYNASIPTNVGRVGNGIRRDECQQAGTVTPHAYTSASALIPFSTNHDGERERECLCLSSHRLRGPTQPARTTARSRRPSPRGMACGSTANTGRHTPRRCRSWPQFFARTPSRGCQWPSSTGLRTSGVLSNYG